jgi:hypothetical protein
MSRYPSRESTRPRITLSAAIALCLGERLRRQAGGGTPPLDDMNATVAASAQVREVGDGPARVIGIGVTEAERALGGRSFPHAIECALSHEASNQPGHHAPLQAAAGRETRSWLRWTRRG